ncbi:Kinesin-related protein 3 [Operophtera brumata]|uniref:Kinesin-related protein 3 n=1 Tax=Operophtera brumata TaxID=104452 RepID=A0A0L7LP90_OPEBR|nr:Kinesin-related protein 3 [Operophtera brumata]
MAPLFFVLALVIQGSFIYADTEVDNQLDEQQESIDRDILVKPGIDDEVVKDFSSTNNDFIDMFLLTNNNMFPTFPTSSAAMMSQATNNNETCEEQLESIKKVAEDIAKSIQSEMANLMSYAMALNATNKDNQENERTKRSVETPMDSTQLVMRLLKHIKSNNEYQNIAIEKMMSAQEIADKFGIEFNPDPEILSDLAVAANDHAHDLTTMLKDACDTKNVTQEIEFIPMNEQPMGNDTYYVYTLHPEEQTILESTVPSFEYLPEILPTSQKPMNHVHHSEPHSHHYHYESQIPPPPVHHYSPPVSTRPNFYDPFPYTSDIYSPYADMVSPAIFISIEEPEPEPEIVGEDIEETITTRLFVERGDEPGSSTVNQVTSYTVAEKTHFKTPQIEKLPQQFQYSFFLI